MPIDDEQRCRRSWLRSSDDIGDQRRRRQDQRLWFIGLAVTVAISALTSLVLLGIGIGKGAEWISAAFTVYSAVVAAIALAGAAAAFYIAYIPYRRWIAEQARRPSLVLPLM